MNIIAVVSLAACLLCFTVCDETPRFGTHISNVRNYYENMSLIGTEISCTEEERRCYMYNRVLQPDGKCYFLEHVGPCKNNNLLYFNKTKAEQGIFKAECSAATERCGLFHRFMAYDQTCYPFEEIRRACDSHNHRIATVDYFGEYRCSCFGNDCPIRPVVTQPKGPGPCRLPNLVQQTFPHIKNPLSFRSYPCTAKEHACLAEKMMLHHPSGKCYPLMEQGPCEEGELFLMNKTAYEEQGLIVSACSEIDCPFNEVRMQIDGQCYHKEVANNTLCPPYELVFDVFGFGGCGEEGLFLPRFLTRNKECSDWTYMNYDYFKDSADK